MSSIIDEHDKQLLTEAVHKLYDEYKDNDYMKQKIISYINVQLPNIFTNMNQTHIQRVARIEELSMEQELWNSLSNT